MTYGHGVKMDDDGVVDCIKDWFGRKGMTQEDYDILDEMNEELATPIPGEQNGSEETESR